MHAASGLDVGGSEVYARLGGHSVRAANQKLAGEGGQGALHRELERSGSTIQSTEPL